MSGVQTAVNCCHKVARTVTSFIHSAPCLLANFAERFQSAVKNTNRPTYSANRAKILIYAGISWPGDRGHYTGWLRLHNWQRHRRVVRGLALGSAAHLLRCYHQSVRALSCQKQPACAGVSSPPFWTNGNAVLWPCIILHCTYTSLSTSDCTYPHHLRRNITGLT